MKSANCLLLCMGAYMKNSKTMMDPLELILWATHSGTIKHHKYLLFVVKAWLADLEKKMKYYAPQMKCCLHFPLQSIRAGLSISSYLKCQTSVVFIDGIVWEKGVVATF